MYIGESPCMKNKNSSAWKITKAYNIIYNYLDLQLAIGKNYSPSIEIL